MNLTRKYFLRHILSCAAAALIVTAISCSSDSPAGPKAPAATPNKVLQLDGVDGYVDVPIANHQFNEFTIEVWVKLPDYAQNNHYVSLQQNAYLVLGGYTNDALSTWAQGLTPVDAGNSAADPTISANAWHHFAISYDGTNQELLVDGVVIRTVATTGNVTNDATSFVSGLKIGARYSANTQFVNGQIDDVRLWNVYRTPAQILANMNKVVNDQGGLVGNWTFDDGTAKDRSAYMADGTLMGGATIVNK